MNYETVIGLEIHVQLSTKSKAFCGDEIGFAGEPNTRVSPISLGHPGTLPQLNEKQLEYAIRLGIALGSEISLQTTFDRKNYFYADSPKGYQITQDAQPICIGGQIPIDVNGQQKIIKIHHVHMEEDAGKSMHDSDDPYSYIDLNRAGTPLLEIVTDPDLRSAEEVDALMTAMRQLVRYIGISDANMQEGNLRCDVNISIRPEGADYYGNRCEVKNVNSMRYARRAVAYEVKRQIKIVESGGTVAQQTLNFDPATGVTSPLRSKEDAHDYRYFPEPDMPPIHLTSEEVEEIGNQLPAFPWEVKQRLISDFSLSPYDANLLSAEKETADFFFELCKENKAYKSVANLIINKMMPWCKENDKTMEHFPINARVLSEFIQLITTDKVSHTAAYQDLFPALIEQPSVPPLVLAEQLNLIQSSDVDELSTWVDQVIAANPNEVKAYKGGKKKLIGFFMGQVMKLSKGQAAPKEVSALLRKKLEG